MRLRSKRKEKQLTACFSSEKAGKSWVMRRLHSGHSTPQPGELERGLPEVGKGPYPERFYRDARAET